MYQFERIACISLSRRPDRWDQFLNKLPEDWPFRDVEKFDAIDGDRCPSPSWWNAGGGAWGCYKSHYNILEQCIQQNVESCLFLEDDAVCGDNFTQDVGQFLDELPNDWGMIYLGGQHLHTTEHPPVKVSEHVYIPYNINRTHAFAIRGRTAMCEIYNYLNETRAWQNQEHIDHHLGRLHERRELPIYCPSKWLIGQDENQSNISGQHHELRYFPPATDYGYLSGQFVAIMGAPHSGAELVAKMVHELGLYCGTSGQGRELPDSGVGEEPDHEAMISRFFAQAHHPNSIATLCEAAVPFPETQSSQWSGTFRSQLWELIRSQVNSAARKNSIAFGYAPQLSACGEILENTITNDLKVISVERDRESLLEQTVAQHPKHDSSRIKATIDFFEDCRENYIDQTSVNTLSLNHKEVTEFPEKTKSKIGEFLGRRF